MKIAFVSHSAELYGAELCLHELAQSLLAAGEHDLGIVCPEDGPLVARFRELGLTPDVILYGRWATRPASPRTKLRLLWRNARGVLDLYRHLRSVRPDLVVTSTMTVPSAAIAACLARVPHIAYVQEFGVESHGVSFHWGRERCLKLLAFLSARVLVASEAIKCELANLVGEQKLRVIYYAATIGPMPRRVPPADSEPLRVVMLGYKTTAKGQDQAIKAVAQLREQGLDVTLTLVGPGHPKYVEELARLTRDLGIEDHVHLLSFVDDPFVYLAASDVALSCSELEGLPRVVVEAMKCGCAVVGVRSGGTEELITEGWNGYLYAPRDVDALAARIALLAADRDHARSLGHNAAKWAQERFTAEHFAADFLTVADEAISSHG